MNCVNNLKTISIDIQFEQNNIEISTLFYAISIL